MEKGYYEFGICKCGAPGVAPHVCPYDVEMSQGEDSPDIEQCNCCEDCESKCADEI